MASEKMKIVTPVGYLAFTQNLDKKNEKGQYSAAILFDKGSDLDSIKKLIKSEADSAGIALKGRANPLKFVKEDEEDVKFEYTRGRWILNFKNGFPFGVIDADRNEIPVDGLKAGDKIKVVISSHIWTYNKDKGVGINFHAIQLVKSVPEDEGFYQKPDYSSYFDSTGGVPEEKSKAKDEESDWDF